MSTHPEEPRQLPENADLRHLKDEAKDLLKAGQAESLARAQFQIARQYGFASWSKLTTYSSVPLQLAGQLKVAIDANDLEAVTGYLMTRHLELHGCPPRLRQGRATPHGSPSARRRRVPPSETRFADAGGG